MYFYMFLSAFDLVITLLGICKSIIMEIKHNTEITYDISVRYTYKKRKSLATLTVSVKRQGSQS